METEYRKHVKLTDAPPRFPISSLGPPQINAGIVRDLATGIATVAPKAFVLVISNPVNSTVPIVAEVFKKHGVYDPKRSVPRLSDTRQISQMVFESINKTP